MELRPEQLASAAGGQALAPVYLIAGPETLRVLEAADAVRAKARAEGISEREVFDADGRDFDWGRLQAGFGQIEAQIIKVGMAAEVTCASKPCWAKSLRA